ncbi:trans-sialidase [Trypanosoma cruzi]|nr:trans-sialidase [Trypanosoma cruzi]
MNGHDALETNPYYKQSPRRVWSGVSPDDRLASPNDVKLTPRDLSGNNTVRVVFVAAFYWIVFLSWQSDEPRSVDLRFLTEDTCRISSHFFIPPSFLFFQHFTDRFLNCSYFLMFFLV